MEHGEDSLKDSPATAKKKHAGGRPPKLSATDKKKIIELAKFGLTDDQLSSFFNISRQGLCNYKKNDPEFFDSLKESKAAADAMVEKSLFRMALGYEYQEEAVNKDGAVMVTKFAKPDVTACIFWLKNRQSEKWRDKSEHDLGDKTTGAITSIAKLFAKRYESEAKRLAAGEDPAMVLFGRANGSDRNVTNAN